MQTEIQKNSVKLIPIPQLIAIQAALKAPKTRNNKFGGFSYRSAADILEAVKPLLLKYGCTTFLTDDILQFGDTLILKATAHFIASDEMNPNKTSEVETHGFAIIDRTRKNMDAAQQTGSASSYARKTALCGLFLIDDAIDPDSLPTMPENAPTQVPPPPGNLAPAPGNPRIPSTPSTPSIPSIPSSSRAPVPPPPPGVFRKNP